MKLCLFLILVFVLFTPSFTKTFPSRKLLAEATSNGAFFTGLSKGVVSFRESTFPHMIFEPSESDYYYRLIKIILVGVIPSAVVLIGWIIYILIRCFMCCSSSSSVSEASERQKMTVKIFLGITLALILTFLILTILIENSTMSHIDQTVTRIETSVESVSNERRTFAVTYVDYIGDSALSLEKKATTLETESNDRMKNLRSYSTLRIIFSGIFLALGILSVLSSTLSTSNHGKITLWTTILVFLCTAIYLVFFGINLALSAGLDDCCIGIQDEEKDTYDYFLDVWSDGTFNAAELNSENKEEKQYSDLNEITTPDIFTPENITDCDPSNYNNTAEVIELKNNITSIANIRTKIAEYKDKDDTKTVLNEDEICNKLLPDFNFLSAGYLSLGILFFVLSILLMVALKYFSTEEYFDNKYSRWRKDQVNKLKGKSKGSDTTSDTFDDDSNSDSDAATKKLGKAKKYSTLKKKPVKTSTLKPKKTKNLDDSDQSSDDEKESGSESVKNSDKVEDNDFTDDAFDLDDLGNDDNDDEKDSESDIQSEQDDGDDDEDDDDENLENNPLKNDVIKDILEESSDI
ncbi:protein tweety [Anaeramoeba flamelloides]|uniref:Protein tweety n=1 Tax=Anaeramoeba flamelloides TaxID=1746091 RepID=A0AAV7YT14_9EUKA|nr:protein tweety [Anaeramoeba flamelloides]